MIFHGLEDVAIERYQNNLRTKEISCGGRAGPQRRLVLIFKMPISRSF